MTVAYSRAVTEGVRHAPRNCADAAFPTSTYGESSAAKRTLPWFALSVWARHEKTTSTLLTNKGFQNLLPMYKCRRRQVGRYRSILLPLFPGYVFCQFDPAVRLPILTTPGVIEIVGCGRIPIPICEGEMEAIRRLTSSHLQAEPWPYLEVGRKVYIHEGALQGTVGILIAYKNKQRLILSVTLLQCAVAVEIDRDWVSPADLGECRWQDQSVRTWSS